MNEVRERVERDERVLVTTLTKKMSEDLTDYLLEMGFKVRYLHSEVDTLERIQIIRDLRLGEYDVLVGVNLLREGLDLPEVSLVAILDADKEGFLRGETSLIQTIGRAARNIEGKVHHVRRQADGGDEGGDRGDRPPPRDPARLQRGARHHGRDDRQGHQRHRRVPAGRGQDAEGPQAHASASARRPTRCRPAELERTIVELEEEMLAAAEDLRFEYAARLRDEIRELRRDLRDLRSSSSPRAARPEPPAVPAQPVAAALLAWYAAGQRDLPWRRTRDPYAILVTEVMLQQTQVARVVPRYERLAGALARRAAALAAAPPRRRAGARGSGWATTAGRCALREACRGRRASTAGRADLRDAAGHRARTRRRRSGAFAFGRDELAVDTNVAARARPVRRRRSRRRRARPAAFNQAAMELGAMVCTARAPRAAATCPLAAGLRVRRARRGPRRGRARRPASASRTPTAGSAGAWWRRWRRGRGCPAGIAPGSPGARGGGAGARRLASCATVMAFR